MGTRQWPGIHFGSFLDDFVSFQKRALTITKRLKLELKKKQELSFGHKIYGILGFTDGDISF